MRYFFTAIFLFYASPALSDFKCNVVDSMRLGDNGRMETKSDVARMHRGKEFTVNRTTGIITGGSFMNNMSGQAPKVFDTHKPKDNSYKAITIYQPNHTVDYLEIHEYVKGEKNLFFTKRLGVVS